MFASFFGFVRLDHKGAIPSATPRDHPGCAKNPAEIGNKCPAREIGEVDFRFGREQNLSIELHGSDPGGVELAFMSEHDLARPKKAGLVLVNLLEPVAEAIGERQ